MNGIVKLFVFPKIMIVLAFFFKCSLRGGSIAKFEARIPLIQMVFNTIIYIGV